MMNMAILIESAQMFFRNFGLRHVNAALGFAIGLADPNASRKIIARFEKLVELLRSRLRPQVPETSIEAQFQKPKVCAVAASCEPVSFWVAAVANAVLQDLANAVRRSIGPNFSPSKLRNF